MNIAVYGNYLTLPIFKFMYGLLKKKRVHVRLNTVVCVCREIIVINENCSLTYFLSQFLNLFLTLFFIFIFIFYLSYNTCNQGVTIPKVRARVGRTQSQSKSDSQQDETNAINQRTMLETLIIIIPYQPLIDMSIFLYIRYTYDEVYSFGSG